MILITNDDGIFSPGIEALWEALNSFGETAVVAPSSQKSAISHAITISRPLKIKKIKKNNGFRGFSVSGTPADCTKIAIKSILTERPDILVSGINLGSNLGNNIIYSGTVSAAMEGTILGIPSIAISLDSLDTDRFELSKKVAKQVVSYVLKNKLPKGIMLNVNVPYIDPKKFLGSKITKQGNQFFNDNFDKRVNPRGENYYWMKGEIIDNDNDLVFDGFAVKNGYASITPLGFKLTEESYLLHLRERYSFE